MSAHIIEPERRRSHGGSITNIPAAVAARGSLRLLTCVLCMLAGTSIARASDAGLLPRWFDYQSDRAWLHAYDPTLLNRRLLTQFEYEDHDDDYTSLKWATNLRWAFSLDNDDALGVQLEAPMRWVDQGSTDDSGFGDLEARIGIVRRASDHMRWGLAVNSVFPTAEGDLLGDGAWVLRPILAFRYELRRHIELGGNFEYNFTPRDEGDDRVSNCEMKFPITVKLADRLSGFTSYNPRWNDVTHSWRHRLEIGAACHLGHRKQYTLNLGVEIPLKDEAFQAKGTLGLSWAF